MIYLDNAATTKIHQKVLEEMIPYLTDDYGNAGTLYSFGRKSADAVKKARNQVANFIGASPEQIVFTSGGSESNNMVFHGVADYLRSTGKTRILISAVEHDSVIKAAKSLEGPLIGSDEKEIKDEFDIGYIGVNRNGSVDMDIFSEMIDDSNVGLVSVMYVNNETGAVNPVDKIGEICREKGILFHTDCVQAAGCHRIDVNEIKCDFLSISSHKIHGVKGVGALYVRDKKKIEPLVYGGSSQEYGLRGGTENVAGIVGFGKACEIADKELIKNRMHVRILKNLFYSSLLENMRVRGLDGMVTVNGPYWSKYGKTLNLKFGNIDGETLVMMLDTVGICVSAGSACRSHESEPSRVLLAMGLEPDEARDSVRISFSIMNNQEEVSVAAGLFAECIYKLKDM